jgi:hypothetical protein
MFKPIILLALISLLHGCSASYRTPEALTGRWEGIAETPSATTKAKLRRGGNKDVTIKVFSKANHTIQPSPDFLDTMIDWTIKRVRFTK